MPERLPPARPLLTCATCRNLYPQGASHQCPTPPQDPLPLALIGLDLDEHLTARQWNGIACALCARRLGTRARVLATVRDHELRACAPACPPR
ncbi:hypothetical protein [Streptomyces litchfieldiae]|uniref:RNHCP domain-containing protein n=1 Tax=Streptomyces litchfieldiae TaxID=3075543 RepID=A0ABU2MN78_9ACTN|nr:hypothetical protein [Streptomyces sp. DSM 44938]MDT0343070.1 hypothetical protein [Streptomyces sp. DSM 44938]